MADRTAADPPSPFVTHRAERLGPGRDRRVLDVAMGRGRHALVFGALGFHVFGVDRRLDAVRDAARLAVARGLSIAGWCADLTISTLPHQRFDVIVVTRYLQRDLFEGLTRALVPGGVMLYETFTIGQRVHGRGPTSDNHLLRPGELREAFTELEVIFYEEVEVPDAVARLVARRR